MAITIPATTDAPTSNVTVPVTRQLTDQSGDIPPFLMRNDDGSFKHPDVVYAIMVRYAQIKAETEKFVNWRDRHLTPHDEEVINQLQTKQIIRESRPTSNKAKLSKGAEEAEEAIRAGASWDSTNTRWKYPKVPQINQTRLKQGEQQIEREGPKVAPGETNFFG